MYKSSILKSYDAEMAIKSDTFGQDCCVVNLTFFFCVGGEDFLCFLHYITHVIMNT